MFFRRYMLYNLYSDDNIRLLPQINIGGKERKEDSGRAIPCIVTEVWFVKQFQLKVTRQSSHCY